MAAVVAERVCAELDGDVVVFLIGMRINKWWKVWAWWWVALAMPRMLIELAKQPELGLLNARTHFGFPNVFVIQYWRSYAQLETYAKSRNNAHLPAWKAFNKAVGSNGDVGIWHETYLTGPGRAESIYNNMPPYGLGAALGLVPATGARQASHQRIEAGLKADVAEIAAV